MWCRAWWGVIYQSKTATHSSISIGSTNYDSTNNLLTADTSERSIGVSFGALTSVPTTTVTNRYYQLEQQTRLRNTNTQWRYDSTTGPLGTNNCNTTSGECYEFNFATWRSDSFNQSTIAAAYNPTIAHVVVKCNRSNESCCTCMDCITWSKLFREQHGHQQLLLDLSILCHPIT